MKKLFKGLRRDERPGDQHEGTWRDARNITIFKAFESTSVEDGVLDVTPVTGVVSGITYQDFPVNKIVIGTIPTNMECVYFFGGNGLYDSEIGIVNKDGNYKVILKDKASAAFLNFDVNFPIKGTFEYKYNNELIIAFDDYNNYSRLLNKDCIPFTVLPDGTINPSDLDKASNLLRQFPNMGTPTILADTDLVVKAGAGILPSGTYYPIVSYELSDGSNTFWCKIYNGVPIYVDSTTSIFEKVGGSTAGTLTNKYIEIKFTDVDVNFKFLRLGYLYIENGITRAYYSSKFIINGTTLQTTITGAEATKTEITVEEVVTPNAVYNKAKSTTNLQGRLYKGNLEQDASVNLQNVANEVVIQWVREKDISLNNRVLNTQAGGIITSYGSYKDPSLVFFDKSFKDGECYAMFLVGKLTNGLYTEAFHIPGRQVLAGDRTALNGTDVEIDAIAPTGVKKFQLKDTTLIGGQMGAWENENEEYPLDAAGTAIHPDYANIPGITLLDRKIRHHVFPDLRTLKGYGENYQTIVSQSSCNYNFTAPDNTNYGNPDRFTLYSWYLASHVSNACFQVDVEDTRTKFHSFVKAGQFSMTVDFTNLSVTLLNICLGMAGAVGDGVNKMQVEWQLTLNGVNVANYFKDVIFAGVATSDNFPLGTQTFNFAVSPGDDIQIYYKALAFTNNNVNGNAFQINGFLPCFNTDLTSTFVSRVVDSQVLGISISNLNIPADIADKLDSWEIFYAKRTQDNIRIVAQDMIKDERYHNFDLLSTQVVAQANYLKPQLRYIGTTIGGQLQDTVNTPNIETAFPTEEFKVINSFQYCGENTSIPQPNANRALNVCIIAGVGETTPTLIQTNYGATNTLTDICIYKTNMYNPFDLQELVSTGYSFKVSASGLQPTKTVFGGDIHINIFGFRLYTNNTNNYLLTCGSASNIGLRYEELSLSKQYYPKYSTATPSYYGYNKDYNCINNNTQLIIHNMNGNCNTDKITKFHQRVIYSISDPNESRFLNWRIFKVNDYYEMPKNRGVIWSILGVDRKLFIHHEYSLFLAEIKDSIGTGENEVFIKSSNVFDRPPIEILSVNEGYAGTQSHFAILYCKLGYCFIDRDAKKVFIYREQLQEISKEGLYNFFKEHGQNTLEDVDNPYLGNGYMMAFDEEYNRLIITKKDADFDFTLSFCQNAWVSEHDYKPHVLTYNRTGLFAVDNNLNKVFKHNNKLVKAKYYDGVIKNSYVDVVFNEAPQLSKVARSINWISEAIKADGTIIREETITHLMVFNNDQCSGIIDLKANKNLWFGSDARNLEDSWNFNDFRDLIKDRSLPFLDNKNQLITSNINNSKAWFDKSLFIGKFVIVRFIKDNVSQNDLHINYVNVMFKKSDRV